MRITKQRLKEIIKEELEYSLREQDQQVNLRDAESDVDKMVNEIEGVMERTGVDMATILKLLVQKVEEKIS
jgi:DNA primase large subunit